jgi:hypothetical protein
MLIGSAISRTRFPHRQGRPTLTVLAAGLPPLADYAAAMDRFVLLARLKPDGRQRAEELLAEHSALGETELATALDRHAIFLSETEVVFLFEGEGSHDSVRAVFNDPAQSALISHWLPLFDGPLHQAEEAYLWER